ncbi:MAG: IcmT/TraK family protein [Alphaproteobacteria bacterium]|jgi:intracellular multiplication protein IcmT|nr:IcmT/TraK family protein [Alphaproteobacteria bacterium]
MANQISDMQEQMNWHWRNSMRPVRFFGFDVRAIIPFCILLFYARISTLVLCFVVTLFFWLLEKKGLTFPAALRSSRLFLFGNYRPGLTKFRHRKLKDYGR